MSAARIWLLKQLDATAGRAACRLAGIGVYHRRREVHLSPVDPGRLRRLLVIRPGGMGDMLQLLPSLKCLAAAVPGARIDLLCERRNRAVAALCGLDLHTFCYDAAPVRTLLRLLRTRYDAAIDTEQFHHFSAVMACLSGAPVRVGFNINPVRNPVYTHLVTYAADGPEAAQFRGLLRPLGIDDTAVAPPLDGLLRGAALPEAPAAVRGLARYAAVHAGSSAAVKQWGLERFGELCAGLKADLGLDTVIVGDRRDRDDWVAAHGGSGATGAPTLAAGAGTLAETAAVTARAAVFVGGDSGLAHLAVALGVPTVVIFGPSDERKWGSVGARHTVVSHAVPCRPCSMFGYHKPCHPIACLRGVTVEQVLAAAGRVLTPG